MFKFICNLCLLRSEPVFFLVHGEYFWPGLESRRHWTMFCSLRRRPSAGMTQFPSIAKASPTPSLFGSTVPGLQMLLLLLPQTATQLRLASSGGKTNCQFNHLTVALRYTSADMRYDYGFAYLQLLLRRLHPARQAIWHRRSAPAPLHPILIAIRIHSPILKGPLIFSILENWLPAAPDN